MIPFRRQFLGRMVCALAVASPAWPARAQPRVSAPALILATEAPADLDPAGYLVSEKYDGVRARWDGRHLRMRSGLTLTVPAWYTAGWPAQALDGELWLGRGRFDETSALVRRGRPDDAAWHDLRFMVFELPEGAGRFDHRVRQLEQLGSTTPAVFWRAVPQVRLGSQAALRSRLAEVVTGGGEGLMLHRADAPCETGRSAHLLKLKPLHDAEAQVLAHRPGRGRHQSRLGALVVRNEDGRVFRLGTGFSDAQREAPPPVGSWVSYTHNGHTPSGLPRFARFWRLRPEGV